MDYFLGSSKEDFDDNICNFLYFWLGDILLKKLRVKEFYSEIILELFKILKNNTRQVCTARYPYIHKDDFEKFKLIFDISEDYKIYKSQIYSNMYCNKNYMTYLETHIQNYNKFHNDCEVESYDSLKKPYCNYFKQYFPNNEHNTLSNMKFYLKEIVPELEKSQEEQGTGEAQEKLQEDLEIGGLGTTLTQPNSGVKASTEERASTSRPYLNTIMTEIPGTSATTDNPSPSIASKSITGAVSVAGILVPSYLMYNYTYAGTWINKVLGRKTRTNFNPYTDQYLMANISGPENFYSERSRYNISYRPE
ncbi:VIR protein [Plasmodium vivax]|uniref:VIR protein n=1 Tax=Plasmodium vivax TaxID=5855 RepID=A0A1G4E3Q1_PLAVI|nr:VIR protein [Plasmodium vivax]